MAPGGWTFLPDYKVMHDILDHYAPRYDTVVAFISTGWNYHIGQELKRRKMETPDSAQQPIIHTKETKGRATVFAVPYSEHSNFSELREFVGSLRPACVVPLVHGGKTPSERGRMQGKLCALFEDLIDKRKATKAFIEQLVPKARRTSSAAASSAGDAAAVSVTAPAAADGTVSAMEISSKAASQVEAVLVDDDSSGDELCATVTKAQTTTGDSVVCPVCGAPTPMKLINRHVDACLLQAPLPAAEASPVSASASKAVPVKEDEPIEQLRALLPPGTRDAQLRSLLRESAGDMSRAMNIFFDQRPLHRGGGSSSTKAGGGGSAPASPAKHRGTGSPRGQASIASFFSTSSPKGAGLPHASSFAADGEGGSPRPPRALEMVFGERGEEEREEEGDGSKSGEAWLDAHLKRAASPTIDAAEQPDAKIERQSPEFEYLRLAEVLEEVRMDAVLLASLLLLNRPPLPSSRSLRQSHG
jgi:hypothetical protein